MTGMVSGSLLPESPRPALESSYEELRCVNGVLRQAEVFDSLQLNIQRGLENKVVVGGLE